MTHFQTNMFSCCSFSVHLEDPRLMQGQEVYFHIPCLAWVPSCVPLPPRPYWNQNRSSYMSLIRRHCGTVSNSSTVFFNIWILASFSLLASEDLSYIFTFLSSQQCIYKDVTYVIQLFFFFFGGGVVCGRRFFMKCSLSCSFLHSIWTKNCP